MISNLTRSSSGHISSQSPMLCGPCCGRALSSSLSALGTMDQRLCECTLLSAREPCSSRNRIVAGTNTSVCLRLRTQPTPDIMLTQAMRYMLNHSVIGKQRTDVVCDSKARGKLNAARFGLHTSAIAISAHAAYARENSTVCVAAFGVCVHVYAIMLTTSRASMMRDPNEPFQFQSFGNIPLFVKDLLSQLGGTMRQSRTHSRAQTLPQVSALHTSPR
jgi:hypothetical protein